MDESAAASFATGTFQLDAGPDVVHVSGLDAENLVDMPTSANIARQNPDPALAFLDPAFDMGSTLESAQAEAAEPRAHDDQGLPPVGAEHRPAAVHQPWSATMLLQHAVCMLTGTAAGPRSIADAVAAAEAVSELA